MLVRHSRLYEAMIWNHISMPYSAGVLLRSIPLSINCYRKMNNIVILLETLGCHTWQNGHAYLIDNLPHSSHPRKPDAPNKAYCYWILSVLWAQDGAAENYITTSRVHIVNIPVIVARHAALWCLKPLAKLSWCYKREVCDGVITKLATLDA